MFKSPQTLCLLIQLFYTCQLFLRYKRKIYILGVLGFLKTTRSFPKIPERSAKSSEEVRSLLKTSEAFRSLRTCINASSLQVLFTSKIRDRAYSFYTWFSFLTWVCVNKFLEIVSSKTATTHIFQSSVRNWPAGVRSKFSTCRRELAPCLAGKGGARQESENRSRKEILKRQIEVRYKESRTANLGLELKNKIFFSPPLFVCLPSPKRF